MNKKNYPEVIPYDDTDKYNVLDFNDDSETYEEEYNNACVYACENGGVIYTIVDGWGSTVDWFKGSVLCDRLGYVVIEIKEEVKE